MPKKQKPKHKSKSKAKPVRVPRDFKLDDALLRPMFQDDVDAVVAIEEANQEFPWSEGIFRDCIRVGYHCWVFDWQGEVVGFTIMTTAPAQESHILNVCIKPAYQGHGMGSRFVHLLLKLSQHDGAEAAFLEARISNKRAQALYERLGFEKTAIRKDYYPDHNGHEDAMIMTYKFDEKKKGTDAERP